MATKIIMFEKTYIDGIWTYKIGNKIVSENAYNILSNDPDFEHLSYVDMKETLGLDIDVSDEEDLVYEIVEEEVESESSGVEPDISGAVDLIREQDYDDAIETMKRFMDRVIYAAQEMAYDDIAKIANRKSVMRQIDREQLDYETIEDE